jgi:hypothetical protein
MKDWKTTYEISGEEGETCNVWTEAETKEEAETIVREENWDVERIVQTVEIK